MNEMHHYMWEQLAEHKRRSLLRDAARRRLLKRLAPSGPSLRHKAARRLGHLLIALGRRLQESPKPIL
jgi:hypothetical protein